MSGAIRPAELKRRALALWEGDRAALLLSQPLLAHLAMQLDLVPVVDSRLSTAATDGRSVFASAPFLLGLSPADRLFVLTHEIWHCALGHFPRQGGREPRRWNIAIDHEANALIRSEGSAVPAGAVYFPEWDGRSAEEVYERIPAAQDRDGSGGRGLLADLHGRPDQAVSGPFDPDLAFAAGGFESWPVRVLAAARQVERNGGKLPASAALLIHRLTRPVLNWRDLLARFVARSRRAERRWDRPDRRFIARGLYMPGRIVSTRRLVVAIDVSGSTLSCLPRFLAELSGVLASGSVETVRVLTFDAALHLDRVLSCRDIGGVAGLRLQGGGGTDFRPMFTHLQDGGDAPDGIIILTDGFGRAPPGPPPCPVLWVLTADGRQPVDWGERVRLPRDAQDQASR
ncbi:hypothetical protein IGS68_00745 [Skermanella sp. TT6]|uniref:Metal-dependent peptidase n=1 Tax=Skermanella cutis TaxID=2775420 RepID=A0ABX7B6A1_9PROT|nr:VWA-like domain-containing protein [Skermanella sp. TT6]QQP89842.1 hypothetical protein IGS68_00745 [Skermanella sp. TT6]